MEYKVLYRKYRPDSFKNLVGQEYTVKMLQNAIINNKISHAYLFTGPRGTGKTSTAKIFAKTINCENIIDGEACGKCSSCLSFENSPDIIEIDAASNNGVDDIRELINNVKIAPTEGKYKIYIIDEVHMMTQSAFNALLLTLEEPPKHAVFIMATTNVESVPITILSRCQRFNFKKFTIEEIKEQIVSVCNKENIKISDEAALEIAYLSEGGMRDALSLVDQLSANDEEISIDSIFANYGSISNKFVNDVVSSFENKDALLLSNYISELQSSSADYKIFIKKLINVLSKYAVNIKSGTYDGNLTYSQIKNVVFDLNDCMNKININIDPYVLIELALLNSFDCSNSNVSSSVDVASKKIDEILNRPKEEKKTINNIVDEEDNLSVDDDGFLSKLKRVRVNNCFVEAQKDELLKFKKIWDGCKNIETFAPDILSMVIDTDVVASSSKYVILTSKLESNVNNINRRIFEIEDALEKKINTKLSLVCLSDDEWITVKKEYIANLKKGIKYNMMEDESRPFQKKKMSNELESLATNVFNSDKIEIV